MFRRHLSSKEEAWEVPPAGTLHLHVYIRRHVRVRLANTVPPSHLSLFEPPGTLEPQHSPASCNLGITNLHDRH